MSTRIIAGRYALELLDPPRPGAAVWRAHDTTADGAVVVAVLDDGPDAAAVLTALAEARHPALPVLLAHGEDAGARYVVTPPRTSATLRARLADGPPLGEAQAAALGAAVADALAALHDRGLVHGTLDAGAVALDDDAPRLEDPATASLARPPLVPADDVRALGLLLREAIGAGPGLDLLAVPGISPRLAALVQSLAASDPPSAAVARDALRRIADGTLPPAPPVTMPAPPAAPRRPSHRGLLAGVVLAIAGLVAVTGAVVAASSADRARADEGGILTIAVEEAEGDLTLPDAASATTEAIATSVETAADTADAGDAAETGDETAPAADGEPGPLPIAEAIGFDPDGEDGEGTGDEPLVLDGDPATAWATEVYKAADLGGKAGVGLILRLAVPSRVTAVRVRIAPTGATATAYAARGSAPTAVPPTGGWRVLARTRTLDDEAATLRSRRRGPTSTVLLWFTELPPEQQGHGVRVAEVEVLGVPLGA